MMFSPGAMLVPGFLRELDSDKSGEISRDEFVGGFDRWFAAWDVKHQGFLDGDTIRDGVSKDLMPGAQLTGSGPSARSGANSP